MTKNVHIVEKDDYTALKLIEYLRTAGYETVRSKSGQVAISAIRSSVPDLIVLATDLSDYQTDDFISRMRNIVGAGTVPIILIDEVRAGGHENGKYAKSDDALEVMEKPVALDALRKRVASLLKVPDRKEERHLTSEVFIREGIIIVEIGGFLTKLDLVALKYRILDTSRTDKTLTKRFYLIIYDLENEGLDQDSFNLLFDFLVFFNNTPNKNFKILTSSETVKQLLAGHPVASQFEIVENYVDGLEKLKSLYLKKGEEGIRVEFLQPDSALFKDVFDAKGKLIKPQGSCFSQDEIDTLQKKGIKTLFYSRKIHVGEDRQINADEDVDVVLDAIRLTGIMVPEQIMDVETKQRLAMSILVVNSDVQELDKMHGYYSSQGFPVRRAGRISEALEIASQMLFDVVIVDLVLEDGRGLDLIRLLRKRETGRTCHFIVTGKTVQAEHVKEAVSLGVRGFLKSPLDSNKLEQIIRR
jgi:DNA-binding response OmpR family regulator